MISEKVFLALTAGSTPGKFNDFPVHMGGCSRGSSEASIEFSADSGG